MRTAVVAFFLSLLCGLILTPIVRRLAHRFGALDHARSSRKIHGRPIPRLGGVAIVIAFYAPLVGLLLFQTSLGDLFVADRDHVIGLFGGGIAIALLGLYDDFRGANAWKKFAVQFGVAGFLYWFGFQIHEIANPFGEPLPLGWLSLPFTMLWIVGVVNALNLIDGLDGLAGGVALVAVVTTFLIAVQRAHPLMMLFSSALAGSIIGFLFYNFNPASIFMGDTGSMFLGFVLAATAIQTNQKASTAAAILIPAIALGLPIMDTLLAIARRALRGRPLFQADKEHIHHRLMALGLSHRQTVLVLYGFCLILGTAALLLTYTNSSQTALLLIVLALVAFVFLRSLGYMRLDRMAERAVDRKRNRALRGAVRPLGRRLRQMRSVSDMWPIVVETAGVFTAVGVRLQVEAPPNEEGTPPAAFSHGFESAEAKLYTMRFQVPGGGRAADRVLELAWADGRIEIDRDTEIAIDIFCEYLGEAIELAKAPAFGLRASRGIGPQA